MSDHHHEHAPPARPTAEQAERLREQRETPADPNRLGNSYSAALNIWVGRQREAMAEIRRVTYAMEAVVQLLEDGKTAEALDLARRTIE